MYQASQKYQYIEDIYKVLSKKYNSSLDIWAGFLEFLFTIRSFKKDKSAPAHVVVSQLENISEPKQVLQRALQSLPKDQHVALITKFGILEFKNGQPENGRTMFEGIVSSYPKRMDIWAVYMDMEVKYGGSENKAQARHLFERCLTNE
jgi:rRNA biogenesis protein RRP5